MLAHGAAPSAELVLLSAGDARVAPIWNDLERAARPPYFASWGWIENWLAALPPEEQPLCAVIVDGGAPAGAFFLGRPHVATQPLFPRRALGFNVTGQPARDALCIEHNAVLSLPSLHLSLARFVELIPGAWQELELPALARDRFPGRALAEPLPRHRIVVDEIAPAPFVDLARVRAAAGGYLSLLHASTRAQVRRARRGFGPLTIEVAADRAQARDFFDELVPLHARRWQESGGAGAFADPWFERFHRRLIETRFDAGELQLVRVRARGDTIGVLYNFVKHGRVLFYQSGLVRYDDPHLKAGYVCHAAAIEHNATLGHEVYDFLGGRGRYKRALATGAGELVWARIQQPLARFAVEEQLRRWKRALS